MAEEYLVVVNGCATRDGQVGRRRALELALSAVRDPGDLEVVVAEARTLSVCALWRRRGPVWMVRAIEGWLA